MKDQGPDSRKAISRRSPTWVSAAPWVRYALSGRPPWTLKTPMTARLSNTPSRRRS